MIDIVKKLDIEIILQIIQIAVIILGLLFVWYQIRRGRKDSTTGLFISSVSERWVSIEERRHNIKDEEVQEYIKLISPVLNDLLRTVCKGDVSRLAKAFFFNKEDLKLQDTQGLFTQIAKEYVDIDSIFNLCEEKYIAGKHLKLVNKRLWRYWEFYIRNVFNSQQMRNYWHLRQRVGPSYPPFVDFVEKAYLKKPSKY